MATEVGSVYIRVRAITDKVAPDIQKAFAGINTGSISKSGETVARTFNNALSKNIGSNVFSKIGQALSDFGGEAGSAREKLYQLTKNTYTWGTAVGTLIGGVSALAGGIVAMAGSIGGAIPAVMGLVGAFGALRVGIAVGQMALGGIMQAVGKATTSYAGYGKSVAAVAKMYRDLKYAQEDAALSQKRAILELEKARTNLIRTQDMPANSMARREALLAYQEAELNLRKAKDKNKDAALEAKDPNIFSGTDPFAGLTESQKEFAKYLVSLKPKFDELKEAAAKGFLPILKKNIQGLMKDVFPTFKQGIKDIAVGLGGLTTNLTNIIRDPKNVELLGQVMKSIGDNLPIMGTIMGNIYSGMLAVLKASDPLVKRFLKFLETKTKTFSDWLKAKEATGELQTFFDKAGDIMAKLGKIASQALGGIGGVIMANFEPGSGGWMMLEWLDKTTRKWEIMGQTVVGQKFLDEYFKAVGTNAVKVLDSIGALVDELMLLGANPNIGKTFEILAEGAPAFGQIAQAFVDAGPSLANLVKDITIFISNFTDAKSMENFFNTIDTGVKAVNKLFENPAVKDFFDTMSQIHGVVFGLIALAGGTGFGFKILGELSGVVKKNIGNISTGMQLAKSGAGDFARSISNIKVPKFNLGDAFAIGKSGGGGLKAGLDTMQTALSNGLGTMKKQVAQSFAEMTYSTNGFVAGLGRFGSFIVANPWVAAIMLVVGAMVLLYTKSEEFRKFVDGAFKNVMGFFETAWKSISAAFQPVSDAFAELMKTLGLDKPGADNPLIGFFEGIIGVVQGLMAVLVPLVSYLIGGFAKGITAVITIFSGFIKIIKGVIDWVSAFFKALSTGKWDAFAKASDKAWKSIKAGAMQILSGIVNFFIDGINNAIRLANDITGNIRKATGGLINLGRINPISRWVPQMAVGGTVMPSAGGTMVNVAEAGRPERIEPLDANGLSNRDKALIDFLTKGKSSGGQSIQIVVNPAAGMNERDLAEMVSRKLAFELRRGAY